MSRIDEALKRVAATTTAETRGGVAGVVRPVRRPDDDSLASYPAEHRAPSQAAAFDQDSVAAAPQPGSRVPQAPRPRQRTVPAATRRSFGAAFDGKLVAGSSSPSVCVEQYRRLAGTMHELQLERDLKTLMVTSALPREGKTLTVSNLALTLSGSFGRRVLLIDADLRRPSVHDVLNLPNTAGLHEVLQSDAVAVPFQQVSPFLTVLPAGRPNNNPMALLTSERMQRLLHESAAQFDWVLLDAPPVGFMPDAGLLAGMTRAVLFVISAGSTPYQLIQRATIELGIDSIVGTVLNRIEERNIPASGYYGSYYAEESKS